jgi:hypothetical protein
MEVGIEPAEDCVLIANLQRLKTNKTYTGQSGRPDWMITTPIMLSDDTHQTTEDVFAVV